MAMGFRQLAQRQLRSASIGAVSEQVALAYALSDVARFWIYEFVSGIKEPIDGDVQRMAGPVAA